MQLQNIPEGALYRTTWTAIVELVDLVLRHLKLKTVLLNGNSLGGSRFIVRLRTSGKLRPVPNAPVEFQKIAIVFAGQEFAFSWLSK